MKTVLFLVAALAGGLRADQIELIEGETIRGVKIARILPDRIEFQGSDGQTNQVALVEVRLLTFDHALEISADHSNARVWMRSGGSLDGNLMDAPAGSLGLVSRIVEKVELPFERLRAVRFLDRAGESTEIPGFDHARESDAELEDLLYVRAKEGWVQVRGLIERITPTELAIAWEGTTRVIAKEKIGAVVFGVIGQSATALSGMARLRLVGGADLVAHLDDYDEKLLRVTLPGKVALAFHAGAIQEITMLTDRIAYLSDLEPIAVREAPFFGRKWGFRTDQNINGDALKLGRVRFEKGLGVHSTCTLEYALDGTYQVFSCVAGLDDSAPLSGSVGFRILLDGAEAVVHQARAGISPVRMRVELGNARVIGLQVDTGEDGLDVGDLADWGDAKLTR